MLPSRPSFFNFLRVLLLGKPFLRVKAKAYFVYPLRIINPLPELFCRWSGFDSFVHEDNTDAEVPISVISPEALQICN